MSDRKFLNAAKSLDTIAKVSGGIFFAAGVVCLIFAALVLILGERMYAPGSFSLDLDFIKLYLLDGCLTESGWIRLYVLTALIAASFTSLASAFRQKLDRSAAAPLQLATALLGCELR